MKCLYLLLSLLISPFVIKAQSICFELDSVECYRIPWQVKSVTDIHKNELIHEEFFSKLFSEMHVKETVKNKRALEYFAVINLADTSLLNKATIKVDDIDARAVMIIHYSNKLSDTIVFNGRAGYFFRENLYLANTKLLLWLIEYLPLSESNAEFLKKEDISNLKKEHGFMMETIREK